MSETVEIYALSDAKGIRYIGKAKDSAKRLKQHWRDARRRRTPVYDWLNSLAARGEHPRLMVLLTVPEASWPAMERAAIAEAREMGCNLLNVAEGGNEPHCPIEVRRANGKRLAAYVREGAPAEAGWTREQLVLDTFDRLINMFERQGRHETAQRCRLKRQDYVARGSASLA